MAVVNRLFQVTATDVVDKGIDQRDQFADLIKRRVIQNILEGAVVFGQGADGAIGVTEAIPIFHQTDRNFKRDN